MRGLLTQTKLHLTDKLNYHIILLKYVGAPSKSPRTLHSFKKAVLQLFVSKRQLDCENENLC